MIFSKCPRCASNRIRRGYRRTPIWWRAFGRYHLLCNACNWEFAGWAIPGTVEAAAQRRRKKRAEEKQRQAPESFQESNEPVVSLEKAENNEKADNNIELAENNIESVEDEIELAEDNHKNLTRVKVRKRVRVKLNK
ncbi:MAG: hypothetical protein M3209_14640 [Acidobacteriota bacterium]|nr:hypothetical protein [Acidobacteriota bacterium]